ncbi:sex-regulated protein janus-A [Anopheles darlingi]|uniref:Sex-regulated protein janus-A n=1 Tax=Anopheles darlingi TaxID=43151 RepID=W5JK57_ANODA|nr:sex-regulated protein janus-A [Anopheles darlingi]
MFFSRLSTKLTKNFGPLFTAYSRPVCAMVDAKLEAVPVVDIDEGIFKYVLIKVYAKEQPDGTEPNKLIVRGFNRAQWHSDIYDEIKVYGYSQGYGKADHLETRRLLLTKYKDFSINCSDEGY